MTTPDVTVSLAVYNTMPYLRETLDSLVAQTIGHDRLEVVAVDDGSTDGSGELLDEYAARHAGVFRVIHQENSGGPAGPCNRALDIATGRFVYFLGADDYLADEALERMVTYADQHDSDIVMGRVVGVNGRFIRQGVFRRNDPDLDRYGSELRWSLANTSLYRRSLIERIGLRYIEGLPFGSDQPFMLEAAVNASKISVLADCTCYYAVDRHERTNISYSTPYVERLRCIEVLVSTAARVVPEGRPRDTILVRHFSWEVPSLLRQGLEERPESFDEVVVDVASFVERFGDEAILAGLRVLPRVLLLLASRGDVETLRRVLARDPEDQPAVVVTADGVYVDYPGFSADAPDSAYRVPDKPGLRERVAGGTSTVRASWAGFGPSRRLVVEIRTNLVDASGIARIGAVVRRTGDDRTVRDVTVTRDGEGATVVVRVPAADVAGPQAQEGQGRTTAAGWRLRMSVSAGGYDVEVPVPLAPDDPGHTRFMHAGRLGTAWIDEEADVLVLHARRIPWRHVPRTVARRLVAGKG